MRGPAIERIKDGAELMMPGVILSIMPGDSASIPPLPVNSLVAINKDGSSVPLAVGQLLLPLTELVKVLGSEGDTRGKAVRVLHYFGDHLWDSGSKREPPADAPAILWASPKATGADAPVAVTGDAPAAATVTAAFGAPADADPPCILEGELALDEPPNKGAADQSSGGTLLPPLPLRATM